MAYMPQYQNPLVLLASIYSHSDHNRSIRVFTIDKLGEELINEISNVDEIKKS